MNEANVRPFPIAALEHAWEHAGSWLRLRWLLPILATLLIVVWSIIRFWDVLNLDSGGSIPIAFAILLAAFLSALPAFVCFVQNVSRKRQQTRLIGLGQSPLSSTALYQTATRSIDSVKLVVDADYAVPIFLLFLIIFVGFMAILIAYSHQSLFETASVLLGGLHDRADRSQLAMYQMQTFAVMGMAFVGSYVYTLGRLLDRVNNNDLYPISIYYYIARIVVACVSAAVLRHTIGMFGDASNALLPPTVSTGAAPILLLIGFGIGFAPDLFILAMIRRAFQAIKIWGARSEPEEAKRPNSLSLLMIDDLTREKIDRLGELEIDSSHVLARQNPFRLLLILPYDLSLLVDWIAQAQLYVLVRETGLTKLRDIFVRDVFDLRIRLTSDEAWPEVCKALDFSEAAGKAFLRQLNEDASFLRLLEVREAMKPGVPQALVVDPVLPEADEPSVRNLREERLEALAA